MLDHMDVVGASAAAPVALDEPSVEGRAVVSLCGPPEVLVALRLQEGSNSGSGLLQIGYFHQHVHNGLRSQPRHGRAAEMLDAPDEFIRQASQQMILLLAEQ